MAAMGWDWRAASARGAEQPVSRMSIRRAWDPVIDTGVPESESAILPVSLRGSGAGAVRGCTAAGKCSRAVNLLSLLGEPGLGPAAAARRSGAGGLR